MNAVLIAGAVLVLSALITLFATFGRSGLRALPGLLTQFVMAHVGEANAARIYAAVKIGLRVAASKGLTVEGVTEQAKQVAVEAASRYAQAFGLTQLTPEYLRELIDAETQKQAEWAPGAVELSTAPELATKADITALAERVSGLLTRGNKR